MEKYCSLKKQFDEPKKPYNLISVSFFLTDNVYKDPLKKYVLGLKTSIDNFYLHFDKSYFLRIYYDDSVLDKIHKKSEINDLIDQIKEIFEDLKQKPRIQLIHFSCKEFKNDKLHIGLFPTFLRFNPLFDEKSKIKNIIISDIEASSIFDLKVLLEYSSNYPKLKLSWRSNPVTNPNKPQKDWIYAGTFLSKVKFEKSLVDKFFTDLENKDSRINKYMQKIITKQKNFPQFKNMDFTKLGNFPYGMDEAFLNFYLKPTFKEKKYPVLYFAKAHNIYKLFADHYKKNDKYANLDKKDNDNINAFYSLIFGNSTIDMAKTAKENYIKVNNLLYPSMDIKFRSIISKNIKKNINVIQNNLDKVKLNQESLNSLKTFSDLLDYVVYQDQYQPIKFEKPKEQQKAPKESKIKEKEKVKAKPKAKSKSKAKPKAKAKQNKKK